MYASLNARAIGLDLTAAETIELAAASGFAGVDLLVRDLVDRREDVSELRRRMADLGLVGGAWPLPVDWRLRNPARFQAELDRLPRLAETANQLGLCRTGTWVPPELDHAWFEQPAPGTAERADRLATIADPGLRWVAGWLDPIVRVLQSAGVSLGIEFIGPATFRSHGLTPFLHSVRDPRLKQLVDWLNDPYPSGPDRPVGTLHDVYHLYAANDLNTAEAAWSERSAVWVHVADLPRSALSNSEHVIYDHDRGLPGESGRIPIAAFLDGLSRAGYNGPVTPEPMSGCGSIAGLAPLERARAVRTALDSVWPG